MRKQTQINKYNSMLLLTIHKTGGLKGYAYFLSPPLHCFQDNLQIIHFQRLIYLKDPQRNY